MLADLRVCALRNWIYASSLALAFLTASSCTEKGANDLGFDVRFRCEADRTASDSLQLNIIPGGCQSGNEPIDSVTLARGEVAPEIKATRPGPYGVQARSFSGTDLVAEGCQEVQLPASEPFSLVLQNQTNPTCEAVSDDADTPADANADAGTADADTADATDAADSAANDATVDATPNIPCATSCDDNNPCTDNVCDTTRGECTNPPLSVTGVECDDIACTVGDYCENGECQSGEPGTCPDEDNNACTIETCDVAQRGCVRTNAPNTTGCNDGITCTDGDHCTNGHCAGDDICRRTSQGLCDTITFPAGVCSDVQCSASTVSRCDDQNSCTADTCDNSVCVHTPIAAGSCSDGRTCTTDRCMNGTCVSTNNCGAGAQCLIPQGQTQASCNCTIAGQELCNNNYCANLNTDVNNCGKCGRVCPSGAACENGACKPSTATNCTARYNKDNDHDYLFCNDKAIWTAARDRCSAFRMGLVIVNDGAESNFVRNANGSTRHWIAANDRGPDTNECNTLTNDEGRWWWSTVRFTNPAPNNAPTYSDKGINFCNFSNNNASTCSVVSGSYQNWSSGQPDNANCVCDDRFLPFFPCMSMTEGQDCAVFQGDGTWDDVQCVVPGDGNYGFGYICETP